MLSNERMMLNYVFKISYLIHNSLMTLPVAQKYMAVNDRVNNELGRIWEAAVMA
jgi:hypothetical protein